jgi:hypothetical protein
MIALLPVKLADEPTERVRRNHHDAIAEQQRLPSARARFIKDVALADGIATPIAHGLGQPAFVTHSPPRGPSTSGRIEEVRDGTQDRAKYVVLMASGYGATVTVDLEVKPL